MTFMLQNKYEKNVKEKKISALDYQTIEEAQAAQLFY